MKTRRFAALVLTLVLLAVLLPARGAEPREVWVSDGDALWDAMASDTRIILEDKPYYLSTLWAREVENLTIVGSGPNSAIVSRSAGESVVYLGQCKGVRLENLSLRHETDSLPVEDVAVVYAERSQVELVNCEIVGGRQGLVSMWNSAVTARDCTVRSCAGRAAMVVLESDLTLTGCTVAENGTRVGEPEPGAAYVPAWPLLRVAEGCSLTMTGCAVYGNVNPSLISREEGGALQVDGCGYWTNDWPEEENLAGVADLLPERIPEGELAFPSTQNVSRGDKVSQFQMYALMDSRGYATNYVRLRDLALFLDGTAAQFDVDWDSDAGAVKITTGTGYTQSPADAVPYEGNMHYVPSPATVLVDGKPVELEGILIRDVYGGGYTYYKLRDLGAAMGFNVRWTPQMIWAEPGVPYNPED